MNFWAELEFIINESFKPLGAGGLNLENVKIEIFVASDKEECKLPYAFYRIKNVVPSQSYCIFSRPNMPLQKGINGRVR